MSYYSVANSYCDSYRSAADKISNANTYLLKARDELAKNKSETINSLIKAIDTLRQYEIEQSKEITKIINRTLEEANSRDIAAKKRAEVQLEYNRNLRLQNENK